MTYQRPPLLAVLLPACLAIAACQQQPSGPRAQTDDARTAAGDHYVAAYDEGESLFYIADIPPGVAMPSPPGVPDALIQPRTGEPLRRAKRPLEKIIADVTWPDYLPRLDGKSAAGQADARLEQRIQKLKQAADADPKDVAAADRLIEALITEADDPAAAVPYLERSSDSKAKAHVPLAARPADQLEETQLMDLAVWYRALAAPADDDAKARLLARAETYLNTFLKKHKEDDIQRKVATLALQRVEGELKTLRPTKQAATGEPPLAAVRAYARARHEWRQGRAHAAVSQLEAANSVAPNRPDILRLLGEIHFRGTQNMIQGAQYLERAVRLDPTDLESVFALGRYELLHLRQPASAIAHFAYVLKTDDNDRADHVVKLLARHYLARALQSEGYDAASIEQFESLLRQPIEAPRAARFYADAALMLRGQASAWQQLGDAYSRLDDPERALGAYLKADTFERVDHIELAKRIVYCQLRLSKQEDAVASAVKAVRESDGEPGALRLLDYLIDAGAKPKQLTGELARIYKQLDRPASLALALANLQKGDAGDNTLRDHLRRKPADSEVFQTLLERWLPASGKAKPAAALRLTAELIEKQPQAVDRYSDLLLRAAGDANKLVDAFEKVPEAEQAKPMMQLLYAMSLSSVGRTDDALAAYDRVFKADKSLTVALARYVEMLLDRGEFEKAGKALEAIKDADEPRIVLLRVRVLRATGKPKEALALLDKLMEDQPGAPGADLILEKARLLLSDNQVAAARRALKDGIDAHPTEEQLYAQLFDMLQERQPPDWLKDFGEYFQRGRRHIPNSATMRLITAELLIERREFTDAERIVQSVLREDPKNIKAIGLLGAIYERSGRGEKAYELFEKFLDDATTGFDRTRQLSLLHLRYEHPDKALDLLTEQLQRKNELSTEQDVEVLLYLLNRAMTESEQTNQADKLYQKAADNWPDHAPTVLFQWAMHKERTGEKQASEKMLQKVIDAKPDHAPANNALGYSWADQGIHLDKAEKMIRLALKQDPDSAAYLDSLGWVFYKRRNFDEAVKWLEKSRAAEYGEHPVILDHLGDALYQAGRQVEALQWWMKAAELADDEEFNDEKEVIELAPKLQAKINAVRTAKEPPLAEAPGVKKKGDEQDD